ncbi:MAG: AsmA family protein [Pseudomonadota bacterium]
MKRLFTILVVLVVVVVGAAFVLPMVVPSSVYKSQLTQQVEAATGRELTIDGKVRFSLFPSAQIEMGKVKLANAPGAKSSDMVAMDQLAVNVGLLPLLSGTLDVKQFVLIRPDINLEVDENGKPIW